ncbi:MAG: hypothetical protein ACRETI_10120 [Steroidobacteraceae bacterium]
MPPVRRLAAFALAVAISGDVAAHAQQGSSTDDGYVVTRPPQVVTPAPAGWVGRKTTDREKRVRGNPPDTDGHSYEFEMTLGGFARKCPSAAGKVPGNFEYTLTADEVITEDGETRRIHYVKRVITTKLEGQVKDDAMLDYIDIEADYVSERTGSPTERVPVRERFRPGQYGEPDMAALERAVRVTGDVAIAAVMWGSAQAFLDAQREWMKKNECVEFIFDPATETVMLGPGEVAQVRSELRTKIDPATVPLGKFRASALEGIGRVTPSEGDTVEESPASFTYTASATPKRGHGFGVSAMSRAGYAEAAWQIDEQARFEGTFTQTQTTAIAGAGFGIVATMDYKTDGRLVWTAEPDSARAHTFGEVASKFYVPTDGEITVKIDSEGKSMAGSCVYEGSENFAIKSLPPAALKLLLLEVAADGRYRIMLRMNDEFLEFQATQICSVQAAPGFPIAMPGGGRGTAIINDAGIVIGRQEGTVVDETVAGRTAAPIVFGPISVTGEWRFKKISQARP